ncbi:MAG: DUF1538 domain-containing protein [Nitrospinae bacterium]|nr:DUF1538 domain-containing protein [Nitrospinota bacterium]
MRTARKLLYLFYKSVLDVLPLIGAVLFFQLFVLGEPLSGQGPMLSGLGLMAVGLLLFNIGLKTSIFPLGQSMAYLFAERGNIWWFLAFAGIIGYTTAIAEPTLISLAGKTQELSDGRYTAFTLRNVAALGVALGVMAGVLRILLGHPIHYYYLGGYSLAALLTALAPESIVGVAYDFAGAAISTVSVPFLVAVGVGLANSIGGRNPAMDGFGLVGFASLAPIITIILYGMIIG